MAFIKKEKVENIRAELKRQFPSWKFAVRGGNTSTVSICLLASDLDLVGDVVLNYQNSGGWAVYEKEREDAWLKEVTLGTVNIGHYRLDECWNGRTLEALTKIKDIAFSQGWYDRSDAMTDYFDTAYYVDIEIGDGYKKPHQKIVAKTTAVVPAPSGDLDFEAIFADGIVSEFVHTQSGDILQVLKLEQRLTKEQFISFNKWLKNTGRGYWSKYAGGFILTTDKNQKVA